MENWWTNRTRKQFLKRADCFVKQYGSVYDPDAELNVSINVPWLFHGFLYVAFNLCPERKDKFGSVQEGLDLLVQGSLLMCEIINARNAKWTWQAPAHQETESLTKLKLLGCWCPTTKS